VPLRDALSASAGHFADERPMLITVVENDDANVCNFNLFCARFKNLHQVVEFNLVVKDPLAVTVSDWEKAAAETHLYVTW
jgi:hypothetical protein